VAKVLITTVPFGDKNRLPLDLLEKENIEYLINPLNKKLTEDQLAEMISDFDVIIAGTEPITEKVLDRAKNLKMISRVGIGLDSVDLFSVKKREIQISYTPDAPAKAVADLTLGLMLSLLRNTHISNSKMHQGEWERFFGRRLGEVTIGIIGLGRIGIGVLARLQGFGNPRILVNDIQEKKHIETAFNFEWSSKEEIYRQADVMTLHVPLTNQTKRMIKEKELKLMKPDALLINTSRGGIINEQDLANVLKSGHLGGAAIDVFEHEPYSGGLSGIDSCLLTSHMGSMSIDCRTRMEIEATEEAVRFLIGEPLQGLVPDSEYALQRQGL
jgi:D-3-phosphoglycerate dehydrogenase / 2-oxoglutarate reductase